MAWPPPPPGTPPQAVPYAPGPAPPPYPPYGGGWPVQPMVPRGTGTREAIRRIREAIGYYFVVLLLELIIGVATGAVNGVAYGGAGVGLLTSYGTNAVSPSVVTGASYLALTVLSGIVGLAAFILLIVSYVKWREGATSYAQWAGEFGYSVANIARRVRADLTRTSYVFIATFLTATALVVAIVIITIGAVVRNLNPNGTYNGTTTVVLTSSDHQAITIVVVGLAIVGAILGLLMYAFATRSHVDSLAPFASPDARARAEAGRRYVLLGAALGWVSLIGLYYSYAFLVGAIPAALLVYGYYEIRGAFDEVLARPLQPNPSARPVERFLF